MTVDRKRLRELAMAHLRCRSAFMRNEKMARDDCLLSDEFAGLDVAEIVVGLLDALEAAEQPAPDDARIPRKPTAAMLNVGEVQMGRTATPRDTVSCIWRAMYDAAIQAQERTP